MSEKIPTVNTKHTPILPMTTQQLTVKIMTMSINIQFFASLREQIGKSQITLPYNTPQNVLAVWTQATDSMDMPANTLCAINMEYVKTDAMVSDGDEVAFFPPVTGG
jgi:molybdopterin synthase sulfur carrier subunit